MGNHIKLFYVDIITYLCLNPDVDLIMNIEAGSILPKPEVCLFGDNQSLNYLILI